MARPLSDPTSSADGRADVVRSFPTTFRGFDQAAVRHHLEQLAAALSDRDRRIAALEAEVAEVRAAGRRPVALDEVTLMATLGEEAARLLSTAKEGAAQMKARAEERTDALLREAQADAARIREEAELDAARRRQDATAAAEAEVEQAKQQGRAMVAEAQAVRERILNDLANRRKKRLSQLELLRQGRDRLLEAYDHVEHTLAENRAVLRASDEDFRDAPSDPPTGEVEIITAATPAPAPSASAAPLPVSSTEAPTPRPPARVVETAPTPAVEPVVPEPVSAEAVVEEPVAVESVVEEPVAVESVVEEPVAVESVVEEPVAVEAVVEEPVAVDVEDDEVPREEPSPDLVAVGADATVAAPDITTVDSSIETDEVAIAPVDVAPVDLAPEAPHDEAGGDERSSVDDLFARIRAARVDAVARAHAVLDGAEDATSGASVEDPAEVDVAVQEATGSSPAGAVLDDSAADAADDADLQDLHDLARSLGKRLKRALADEQNELLDRLRRATKSSGPVLAESTAHAERYRAAAEDDLWTAAVAGAEASGLEPLAAAASLDAGDVLDRLLDQLGERLSEPLRLRLEAAISGAPDDAEEVANAVRSVYREWKQQRIDPVAESLVQAAYQQGSDAGRVTLPG
jgi:cell division septum initiation protein DivIVA